MFAIARAQLTRLQERMLERFEQRLVAHIEEHFPVHWRVIGAKRMLDVVRFGIRRTREAGYRTERDGYLFMSLMLQFGSYFDSDPQYPWLAGALASETVASRSERLVNAHDAAIDYLDRVAGDRGQHMAAALQRVRWTLIPELLRGPAVNFQYLLDMLSAAWPQKVPQLGEQPVRLLAQSVMSSARDGGLTTPAAACLYVVACFLFGHGLDRDPQFPWAGTVLAQRAPADRAMNAFAKALEAQLAALE